MAHWGYKLSIVIGLLVAGVGALLFLPAAQVQSYPLFLFALFVLASGITLLQVAANPYVSLLGAPAGASSRLNLAQALNSLGHTLGPPVGGMLILAVAVIGADALAALPEAQQAAYRAAQAASVKVPYLGLTLALFALAAVVYLFRLPPLTEATEQADPRHHSYAEAWRHRALRLGVIGIFVYVGAEVAIGSFLINYLGLPQIGGMAELDAKNFVAYYWGGAMLGRFVGSLLLQRIAPARLLSVAALCAAALLLATMTSHGAIAVWSVVAIGLFNSIQFPTIFTLGIAGLGPLTPRGSGLLVMAIVGGAVVPLLQGLLADRIGVQAAFALPLLCYLYVAWYGRYGAAPQAVAA
jgi:FHS family L-fucose permease-like MFS transporter